MLGNTSLVSVPFRVSLKSTNVTFHQLFNLYIMTVVLSIGVIANVTIMVTMRDASFRKLPISIYFTALAMSDTLTLALNAGHQFLLQTSGTSFFQSTILCCTCGFLLNVASGTSSWFIVCISAERLLVVKFPLKAKYYTSKMKACVTLLVVTFVIFLLNSSWVIMVDYTTTTCQPLPMFRDLRKTFPGMMFAMGMNLVPLCITCLCYVILVILVVRKRKVAPVSGGLIVKEKVTATSLYICLASMILTSPFAVYVMLLNMKGWLWNPTDVTLIFDTLTQFLRQINYSVNFFISMVLNSQFRKAVYGLFRKIIRCVR